LSVISPYYQVLLVVDRLLWLVTVVPCLLPMFEIRIPELMCCSCWS
jgi:hypothetical protein